MMPHKALFTTPRGIEDITAQELQGLGVDAHPRPLGSDGWAWGMLDEPLTLAKICYQARTIERGMLVLTEGKVRRTEEGLTDIYELVRSVDWMNWLTPEATFRVSTKRRGRHHYQSPDIERTSGQAIIDQILVQTGHRQKVSLTTPDVTIRVDVTGENCFVGIDFVGEDGLHKRDYRVYDHPASLNALLASAMVIASGWQPDEQLVDPMCGGGTIIIEAALLARHVRGGFFRKNNFAFRKLPCFAGVDFDELMLDWESQADWEVKAKLFGSDLSQKHLSGAQMNAERALVADTTKWQVMDMADLPKVFQKGSVQCIITNPPFGIRSSTPAKARETHRTLCEVADELLGDNGRLVVITHHPEWLEMIMKALGFLLAKSYSVVHGDLPATVLVMRRQG